MPRLVRVRAREADDGRKSTRESLLKVQSRSTAVDSPCSHDLSVRLGRVPQQAVLAAPAYRHWILRQSSVVLAQNVPPTVSARTKANEIANLRGLFSGQIYASEVPSVYGRSGDTRQSLRHVHGGLRQRRTRSKQRHPSDFPSSAVVSWVDDIL